MKAVELKKDALQNKAYYIEGDDLFWIEHATDFFASLVPEEYRSLNLRMIDALGAVADIADAVQTFSMFPSDTVVIVRDTTYKEKLSDKGKLETIAERLDGAYLVLIGKNLLTTPKLRKLFVKIDANRLEESELGNILRDKYGDISIPYKAFSILVAYCNRDMSRIHSELIKLKAYKDGGQITAEDVRLNVADTTENAIYELSNALALRNNARAYEIMDKFFSRNVSCSYMLASLAGQYRRMLYAALSPLPNAELAELMGAKEFAVKKARDAASKYTKKRLKDSLDTLTQAEFAFKSGIMSDDTALRSAVSRLLINY
ncbi:MAG: DNA polymerase III subunit delta [Clostridia bacterium]|nr:DNA polymerase III subunit delta [Clostridia bacterium]